MDLVPRLRSVEPPLVKRRFEAADAPSCGLRLAACELEGSANRRLDWRFESVELFIVQRPFGKR